jgi:DNA replication protein DnaC
MACPICDDTGWRRVTREGREAVTRCDCWHQGRGARLLAEAHIPRRYHHCDFGNFLTYGNESLERASAAAQRLGEEFPLVDRGLFLLGPPGVGKTHLCVAAVRQAVARTHAHALFYDTRELLRVIRQTYDPIVHATESEVLRPVLAADLLVLDDLGAEKTSEWVEETLNLIVNHRYSERRITLFTSNYDDKPDHTDPDSLIFRIGVRMRSRLHEMCDFLHLDGADFRELPHNGGADDLRMLWELRRRQGAPAPATRRPLPSRGSPAKAQLRDRDRDPRQMELKWTGGRAGN